MMSGSWDWVIWLSSLLAIILLVVLVVGLMRQPRSSGGDEAGKALRILDERFARGEIDEDD